MSLKDNVNAIKNELNTEEQFLEGMIKAEGFFKKNRTLIIVFVVTLLALVIAYNVYSYMKTSNIEASNVAYSKLLKNPDDKDALNSLKSKNSKLYQAFLFSEATKNGDLNTIKSQIDDPVLLDLLSYHVASKSEKNLSNYILSQDSVLKDLALLQEGYLLLKSGKTKEAKAKLLQINANSPIKGAAQNLSHFDK